MNGYDPLTSTTLGDTTLTDPMGLGGTWSTTVDTSVDASSVYAIPANDTGTMSAAIANDGLDPTPPGQPSGTFTALENTLSDGFKALLGGGIQAGTSAAKAALGGAIGSANPGPSNSNTNLANKTLLSRVSSWQQAFLGGIATDPKTHKTNWWLVGGIVVVFGLILLRIVRG